MLNLLLSSALLLTALLLAAQQSPKHQQTLNIAARQADMHACYAIMHFLSCTSWKAPTISPLPLSLYRTLGRPSEFAPLLDNGDAVQRSPDCCFWPGSGLPSTFYLLLCCCSGHGRHSPLFKLQYSAACWYACTTVGMPVLLLLSCGSCLQNCAN